MKYQIKSTNEFKNNYKLIKKRGKNLDKLKEVITKLSNGETLDEKYKDHKLKRNFLNLRECHIEPDWLLIYYKDEYKLILVLTNTGSHSDLF